MNMSVEDDRSERYHRVLEKRLQKRLDDLVARIGNRAPRLTGDKVRDAALGLMEELCERYTSKDSDEHIELGDRLMDLFVAGKYAGKQEADYFRKRSLKRAGEKGGRGRHQRTSEIKAWALEKAKGMKGSDIDIARRLARFIPESMLDASRDPERLIYEAIRSSRVDTAT